MPKGGGGDRFDDSRPQFRNLAAQSSKVVIDERFASVLTDPKFQVGGGVSDNKTGKKKTKDQSNEFYTTEKRDAKIHKDYDDKVSADAVVEDPAKDTTTAATKKKSSKKASSDEAASRIAYLTALSRGTIDASSSDDDDSDNDNESGSSSSSSDDDDSDNDEQEQAVGILDPTFTHDDEHIVMTDDTSSPFLAVQHLEWTHVRAVDIFAILVSFTAPGAVKSVTVYPSDFGQEKMNQEQLLGPVGIWKQKDDDDSAHEHDDTSSADDDSQKSTSNPAVQESDFDQEKLRLYEASKLRYYFAVAEFTTPQYADVAYHQVDGIEFEHSSAAVDLRSIPVDMVESVIHNRPVRDQATSVPTTYDPPEFVVQALQNSSIDCTWDTGDQERERVLTQYGKNGEAWAELVDGGQLNAYIASEGSSDDEQNSEDETEKAQQMRKMLGLDSDNDDEGNMSSSGDDEDDKKERGSKSVSFVPGGECAKEDEELLSPWEKYQEKRKQKRREKRQQTRERRKTVNTLRKSDAFLVGNDADNDTPFTSKQQSKAELELLVVGDDDKHEKDYDMRGLERLSKNKVKKLRGARKRKEAKHAAGVTGTEFEVDTMDDRFNAVLDGTDARFGIDRTDPKFRDTQGMHHILQEQTRRRKEKRQKQS